MAPVTLVPVKMTQVTIARVATSRIPIITGQDNAVRGITARVLMGLDHTIHIIEAQGIMGLDIVVRGPPTTVLDMKGQITMGRTIIMALGPRTKAPMNARDTTSTILGSVHHASPETMSPSSRLSGRKPC